jgi:Domain of unknown function (DUF4390)
MRADRPDRWNGSRTQRSPVWAALCLCVAALFAPRPATADALDGTLVVRAAYVTVEGGVFKVNARVEYPIGDEIRNALLDGVSLHFDLQATVSEQRRFWPDAGIADLVLTRELSWHAVSERYVVRDPERGEVGSYAALEQAVQAIGNVDAWPVVVESQLEADASYLIAVRASVRRGKLPDALRSLIWWSDSWRRSSDWYSWPLPR